MSALHVEICGAQTGFRRGENGKLGGSGVAGRNGNGHANPASVEAKTGLKGTHDEKCDSQNLPWLLSLAKTTALLAGRLSATIVVGDSGISPFLEECFHSPVYSIWLESDLFKGGCDPCYEGLMLAPLAITSRDENPEFSVPGTANMRNVSLGGIAVTANDGMRSRQELDEFLEGVASGSGQGRRFVAWLAEALAPSNTAYRIIKRQAKTGQDGRALARVERAMMAAMLRQGGLGGDASLFSAHLERQGGNGVGRASDKPPRRFAALWKSTAAVRILQLAGWRIS